MIKTPARAGSLILLYRLKNELFDVYDLQSREAAHCPYVVRPCNDDIMTAVLDRFEKFLIGADPRYRYSICRQQRI
jgi:hypothetical protein